MQTLLTQHILLLSEQLLSKSLMLATAESCTGGGLAYYLTSLSGSSTWFERGFVTYSNQAKIELLDVKRHTIETHGAVSAEVAQEMAEGVLQKSHATISLSITGIAGPLGGTEAKPVGTVWFGLATKQNTLTKTEKCFFRGNRSEIREAAILHALNILIEKI